MSRTKKPCIGCKAIDPSRSADELCGDCKLALEVGRKITVDEEKVRGRGELFAIPAVQWWPPYYAGSHRYETIERCVARLVHSVGQKPRSKQYSHKRIPSRNADGGHDWWTVVRLSKVAVKAIDELDLAINGGLAHAYVRGVKCGQDLLAQLASGEITTSALEKKNLQLKRWAKGK